MKILVDNLYFGSIWESNPEFVYDGELIVGAKYHMIKVSNPFLLRVAEDEHAITDMKLIAYSIGSNEKYSLQPSLSRKRTFIVNPNELESLRKTFPRVKFPLFIESHDAKAISDIYNVFDVRTTVLGLSKKEAQEEMTKEIRKIFK